jgi:ABC-type bacteriocin/lantibiotic exporter with double-glycine peptidase domain
LEDGDFRADSGEIVSIIGPSGEGKTTLLRLLLGIVTPQGGTLTVQSADGTTVPISAATRPLFAYVPQGNTLFSGTVAENLRLLRPDATDAELREALRLACADEFVDRLPLQLDTPVREQGNFSEGQLQRLCIARALLSDAPILLMDECTSALDADTERQVLQNILSTQKARICIVTTHRTSVQNISQRVYAIRGNRIEAMPRTE